MCGENYLYLTNIADIHVSFHTPFIKRFIGNVMKFCG